MHLHAGDSPFVAHVTLNGVPVADCREASEEGGFVVIMVRDSAGAFQVDRVAREVMTQRLEGAVKITISDRRR